jgi:hypothetical protein
VRHHLTEQPRCRVQNVLAVVQHEQQVAIAQVLDHRLLDRQPVTLPYPERGGHRLAHRGAVGEWGQLAQPHPVREPGTVPLGHLQRQPGLADTAHPGESHQRRRAHRFGDPGDLVGTAHEGGTTPRQVRRRPGPGGPQCRIMRQQPPVHDLGRLGRLHPELFDEPAAQVPVHGERVGLAPGAVQGAHQQGGGALALGEAVDERLELGDGLVATAEVHQRLGPLFGGGEPKVCEPRDLGVGIDVRGVELGEHLPAPQRERGVVELDRSSALTRAGPFAGLAHKTLELHGVELAVADSDGVAGRAVAQALGGSVRRQHRAQPRDIRAQRGEWLVRGALPHTACTRRSVETTAPGLRSNAASSARGLRPPIATGEASTVTSSGPRIRNVTVVPALDVHWRRCNPIASLCRERSATRTRSTGASSRNTGHRTSRAVGDRLSR